MASKSVLELAVGTGQWDAGLKKAKSALDNFTQANGGLQSALNKDSQSMQQFVKMMGQMDSTAKTAKGQMNDYKGTIEALTMQYNRMTDAQKKTIGQDYLHAIDQMKQKYQGVAEEVQKINQSLNSMPEPAAMSGGGLFGGSKMSGMLQVFGGNVMTKLAGAGMGFVTEMGDMVKQGIELARAGEGIRIAFERLGRGDILDGLRQATHGTVTDLELMKAAVKFNDFKLPLDELGTMLAFAQQKAKDTGQSVDYMVDSIVTGLGRKSVMILDNLGISAAQIKERMKEGGDMTKAVGAIIRDEMAKAGDYVETAADRAAQANVSLQNKMEELGRKFGPLEQASSNLWTSIKIGIMDIVGGPLTEFINKLTEAGRLAQQYGVLGGSGKVGRMINNLSGTREGNRQSVYQQQQEQFWRYINPREQQIRDIRAWQRGERGEALQKRVSAITDKYGSLDAIKIQAEVDAAKKMLNEYIQAAKTVLNVGNGKNPSPTSTTTTPTGGGASGNTFDASKTAFTGGEGFKADPNANFLSVWAMMGGDAGLRQMMGIGAQQFDIKRVLDEYVNDPDKDKREKANKTKDPMMELSKAINGLTSIRGGLEGMGIKLPAELEKGLNVLQGLMSIIQGVQAVISIFSTSTETANTIAVAANTVALGTLTAAVTANTMTNFLSFAKGGIVKAANGYVSGTTYSGDQIPAMLNAGEVVLNRSQQGVLAASLQAVGQSGEGGGDGKPYVSGEMIWLGLTNYLNRSGRGEIVTSKRR